MKLFKTFCFIFCMFTSVGFVYAVPKNQTIICNQDCTHVFTDYEGIVTLLLECNETSGVSITGVLTVNGITETHNLLCDDTPPICTTILNPSGWTNTDTEAIVGDCSDDLSGCDYSVSSVKTKTITEYNHSESAEISDNAGNKAICSLSPPSQIDQLEPISCTTVLIPSGWTNGSVEAVVSECIDASETGQDGKSGCDPDQYFSTTVSDGETGVSMAFDKAGNGKICSESEEVAMIDTIPPILDVLECLPDNGWTTDEVSCNYVFKDIPSGNGTYSGLIDITSSLVVDGAGDETYVSLTESGMGGELIHVGDFSFNTSQDRTYTLSGSIFDEAGNEGLYSEMVSVKIDKESPIIVGDIITCLPSGWTNEDVSCSYTIEDPNAAYNSGLGRLQASDLVYTGGIGADQSSLWSAVDKNLGSVEMVVETMASVFDEEQYGNYKLDIEISDIAGNTTVLSPGFSVKIDKTAPTVDNIELTSQGLTQTLSESTLITFEADEEFELKLDIEDNMSGIDWNLSTINIAGPQMLYKEISSLTGGSLGIEFFTSTQTIVFSEFVSIFEDEGLYTINLEIYDNVGNFVNITNLQVEIKSSEAIITNNNGTDCTGTVLANNEDVCTFSIEIKDRFGNSAEVTTDFEAVFDIQDMNGSYNLIDNAQNAQEAFINGLRFNDGGIGSSITANNKITFKSKIDKTQDISIKAIAPSIEIITGSLEGSYLAKSIKRFADIIFSIPNINPDGDVSSVKSSTIITFPLTFKPWVNAFLSDRKNEVASDPLQFSYEDAIDIHANLEAGSYTKTLPTNNLKAKIRGFSSDNTVFSDINLSTNIASLSFPGGAFSGTNFITTHLNILSGVLAESNVAFTSMVEHDVLDNWGTIRTIEYPGGNLGNRVGNDDLFPELDCTITPIPIGCSEGDVSSIVVGADIEGQILTEGTNFTYQEDGSSGKSGITRMGNISATDIREEITQNTYELIRGLSAETNTTLNNLDLGINEVKYFNGDVTLSGIISGKGTIVIKDGNLIINNDLVYDNDVTDSLGVILINSSAKSHPTTGNIYVKLNVQNIVGTYFADGGFMSVDNLGNPDINREDSEMLKKQLLLNGTLLTRNTLGGAMFNISGFLDPWGTPPGIDSTAKRKIAQKYDLHFVRRYKQSGDIDPTIKGSAPDYNPYCVADGVSCDTNKHAFIIRPDGKVRKIPTPGF